MATIIIQENDGAVLDVLTLALTQEGHRTIPVSDAAPDKISSLIREHSPQLVLVDFRSATKTGTAIIAAIRKVSAWLPVVALSCEVNISKKISHLGFNGLIEKPFDLYDFFDTVNSYINRPKAKNLRLASGE